ncbi:MULTISPECIES: hypothetical protein [unclassified Curtobacterium]|uniref:hypothetical protein n=1 Tax=unclassified Curtobacterium TaxID=257496 RepID=UPI0009F44E16|nr:MULTISPECIES: hypothetical protein [unclassified Curtobacterium]WIB01265.1 hypothetical protein QOL15_06155 [Curtobacterium sp. MCBA15_012]
MTDNSEVNKVFDQVELVSDGDGIAVIGTPSAVEQFLRSEELGGPGPVSATDLPLSVLGSFGQVTAAGMASSGKWVQLADESAAVARIFDLVKNSQTGLSMGIAKMPDGQFVKHLQFVSVGPMVNPTTIASIGTLMSQMALQKSIHRLGDYLEVIDEKVDHVLRNQQDAVLADMIGVDFVIEDASTSCSRTR